MNWSFSFRPKLVDTLKGYSMPIFFADFAAGLIVGIVALPLSMALAIASGLKPETGIFTAIIGGFFVSALGGSRVQIGGPAGAFLAFLAPIFLAHRPAGLAPRGLIGGAEFFCFGGRQ